MNVMKWILSRVDEAMLGEQIERYWGVIHSRDLGVYKPIDKFRKFHCLTPKQLGDVFKGIGFELPLEAKSYSEKSIQVDEYIISFITRNMTEEVWVDYYGRVEKYRLNKNDLLVLYEIRYDPTKELKACLYTSFETSSLKLEIGENRRITCRFVLPAEKEFSEIREQAEVAMLQHMDGNLIILYYAISKICPRGTIISLKLEERLDGNLTTVSRVYFTGDHFEEVGVNFEGGHLWVKGRGYWRYISNDGLRRLFQTAADLPVIFNGCGKCSDVLDFNESSERIRKEAEKVCNLFIAR